VLARAVADGGLEMRFMCMSEVMGKRAVILLSGGLDSATTLAMAKARGFELYAMSFDYGQRHSYELTCAKRVAAAMGVARHVVAKIDPTAFTSSALTNLGMAVPKDQEFGPTGVKDLPIPTTYVPARNTVFLSFALAWAEVLGAFDIFLGVNAIDYSGYPDCRPEFIEAFEKLANLATAAAVEGRGVFRIHTPLIRMKKSEIIREGLGLKVPYELTHSCYDPGAGHVSCGHCDSCRLRLAGFAEAGARDPLVYAG